MSRSRRRPAAAFRTWFPFVTAALLLGACTCQNKPKYTVGGDVTGLQGSGLVLQNNAGDDLSVTSNGAFTFSTALESDSPYAVTVKAQPAAPSQTCSVANSTGTMGSANVTNVAVTCITSGYSVGGMVSGLQGSGLVLQNNAGDDLSVTSNGAFTFPTNLEDGSTYAVTIKTQPTSPSQTCSLAYDDGVISSANVTTVTVTCVTNTYAVGGTVSGLQGSGLVLQNNAGDDLGITADGAFTFPIVVASGAPYAVTVKTQPANLSQTCAVANGTATMGGADVTNVAVTCTTNAYPVGGTVSGLQGSGLVLQNNLGDDLSVTSNGAFAFATGVLSGGSYSVSVKTHPSAPAQICTVTNGAGGVTSAAITSVTVTCVSTFSVGGTLTGLTLSGLVLASPGEPDLAVNVGATTFTFATRLPIGSNYDVTVKTQPLGLSCTVQNGSGTITSSDVTSVVIPCVRIWSAAEAGSGHGIGITANGSLWVWGWNSYGQVGDGTQTWRNVPIEIGSGYASVAGGYGHTLAVKADGTLWAWGYNNYGQLGDGTTANKLSPVQIGTGYASVSAGQYHTVAVKTDGTLWAWGYNAYGQLGNGTLVDALSPVQIGTGYASVCVGDSHTLAVKTDGTLWAWGRNNYGQLGDGSTINKLSPVQIGTGFSSAAAGQNHSIGVKADQTLWAWGYNNYGQLGDGTTTTRLTPVQIGTGYSSATAGSSHTLGVKADQTLWAWGYNTFGQLGDGTNATRSSPVPVGTGYSSVAAGQYHTLALTTGGLLFAWGRNNYGQLGDGSFADRISPVPIP